MRRFARLAVAVAALASAPVTAFGLATGAAHAGPVAATSAASAVRLAAIEYGCSIGFGGHDASGAPVVVTAGHCAAGVPLGTAAWFDLLPAPSGRLVAQKSIPGGIDYAAIRLDHGSIVPLTQVTPPPTPGSRVCKVGRVSGKTCGTVTLVTEAAIHVQGMRVVFGDSGGGLYDTAGHVVGITSGALTSALPRNTLAAALMFGGSMLGLTSPVPAIFSRADQITRALHHAIGFAP
ncbi:trypsin-like peptidase domain-containing protein [Gordonia effusa]|nr:trypsin-like peptidase domain-containing protein [Gordonia effusa]